MSLFEQVPPQPPEEPTQTGELRFKPHSFRNESDPALVTSPIGEIFKMQIVSRLTSIVDKKSVLTTSEIRLLPREMISSHTCPLCQNSFKLPPPVKWTKERKKEYVIALAQGEHRTPVCLPCVWKHAPELSLTWGLMNAAQQWVRKAVERFGCKKVQ